MQGAVPAAPTMKDFEESPAGGGGWGGEGGEEEGEGVSTLPATSKSVRGVPLSQEGRRVLDSLMGALEDVWGQELPRFGEFWAGGEEGGSRNGWL